MEMASSGHANQYAVRAYRLAIDNMNNPNPNIASPPSIESSSGESPGSRLNMRPPHVRMHPAFPSPTGDTAGEQHRQQLPE
ncbi:hypothetical protein ASNO1_38280 [Corallococcus caeni]|uniref:Uncharacterized protein n=1 Tax=Corallococcus caeni TaxID=3082388 RepID=A0ABQ6QU82_9BACT|nr:hypothetical protein ASNO1_38280 [Corallococcus sp. NO1]